MAVCERPQKPPFSPRTCAGDPGIIGIIPKRSPPDCNLIVAPGSPLIGAMQLNILPPIIKPPEFGCVLPLTAPSLLQAPPVGVDPTQTVGVALSPGTANNSTDSCDLKLSLDVWLPPLIFNMGYDLWASLIDTEIVALDWVSILGKLTTADWDNFPIVGTGPGGVGGQGNTGDEGKRGIAGPPIKGPVTVRPTTATKLGLISHDNTAPAAANWLGIAYGNGVFVIISSSSPSELATSADGEAWAAKIGDPDWRVNDAPIFGNGVFMAKAFVPLSGGTSHVMYRSVDGENWSLIAPPVSGSISGLWFANGFFWVASGPGINSTVIYRSPNGTAWTASSSPSGRYTGVFFAQGLYIASRSSAALPLLKSVDGLTWVDVIGSPVVSSFTYASYITETSQWILANDGAFVVGDPLIPNSWTVTSAPNPASVGFLVSIGSLLVGVNGQTSLDGVVWISGGLPDYPNQFIHGVVADIGDGTRLYTVGSSANAGSSVLSAVYIPLFEPSHIQSGPTYPAAWIPFDDYKGFAYGNGIFVYISRLDVTPAEQNLRVSSDGINYIGYSSPSLANGFELSTGPCLFINGVFVIHGCVDNTCVDVKLYTSADGINWSITSDPFTSPGSGSLIGVANNLVWVFDPDNNTLYSSPNAAAWSAMSVLAYGIDIGEAEGGISYDPVSNIYMLGPMATGIPTQTILASTDGGFTWVLTADTGTSPFPPHDRILFGNGVWVLSGEDYTQSIAYSTNAGASWTTVSYDPADIKTSVIAYSETLKLFISAHNTTSYNMVTWSRVVTSSDPAIYLDALDIADGRLYTVKDATEPNAPRTASYALTDQLPRASSIVLEDRLAPKSPHPGDIYFDALSKKHRAFDGTIWNNLY